MARQWKYGFYGFWHHPAEACAVQRMVLYGKHCEGCGHRAPGFCATVMASVLTGDFGPWFRLVAHYWWAEWDWKAWLWRKRVKEWGRSWWAWVQHDEEDA